MKTRIGKIAQLPKKIREELNRRLEDGQQGPELLPWLNELPVTKDLLNKHYDAKPITKSNLSEWRHGGYQDWLRLQAREERIQRVAEQGNALGHRQGHTDLYESFSRIVIADLALDLETLNELPDGNERSKRLRTVCQEFVWLQNGFNRSRRAELSWEKWRRKIEIEDAPFQTLEDLPPAGPESPEANSDQPAGHAPPEAKYRTVYFAPCGCVCRQCHPRDGEYPYWEAERDHAGCRMTGLEWLQRDGQSIHVTESRCDCTCVDCEIRQSHWASGQAENHNAENSATDTTSAVAPSRTESRRTVHKIIHYTKCRCGNICPKCHPPGGEYPAAQAETDILELQQAKFGFIRRDKSVSIGLRNSLCNCICEQCASTEDPP